MKRFVLYLLFVPIIAPVVEGVWMAVGYGFNQFHGVLEHPGFFLWSAYFNWIVPALAIATADRLFKSDKWRRLGAVGAVGYVATLLIVTALSGRFWRWGIVGGSLIGAIAALVCCLLIDQLNKEHLSKYGPAVRSTIKTLRRWPD